MPQESLRPETGTHQLFYSPALVLMFDNVSKRFAIMDLDRCLRTRTHPAYRIILSHSLAYPLGLLLSPLNLTYKVSSAGSLGDLSRIPLILRETLQFASHFHFQACYWVKSLVVTPPKEVCQRMGYASNASLISAIDKK
jgi:hypothetical protein